ncbi:Cell division protein DamX [Mixta intestinalis]|uniref:Cell division protein DamX n=1 Tax=Mixta intestinalis TaxID=1615494 RepID=A0A6P1Q5M4_9GAMM|nr:Cell division protein DamX [Mixta intestinalis]
MDEFKPEDELKPDTSDRRPTRPRKASSAPKSPASRQRMMMGIGVLVLLLLVIGIGSALNGPDADKPAKQPGNNATTANGGNEKNIDLSGSSAMSGQGNTPGSSASSEMAGSSPQPISVPPVSPTPTQAAPVEAPQGQQRVELPGDLNNALTNQQGQIDSATQGAIGGSSLPTAPATVSGNIGDASATNSGSVGRVVTAPRQNSARPAQTRKPAATQSSTRQNAAPVAKQSSKPAASATHSSPAAGSASSGVPGGSYTLQLSSASRADTLNAWAKKQNLNHYHVYQTTRNGQPWYVLVSGSYATPADAKRAVASLPAEVQAQKPLG